MSASLPAERALGELVRKVGDFAASRHIGDLPVAAGDKVRHSLSLLKEAMRLYQASSPE